MLLIVLLFGLVDIIFGLNSSSLQSPSILNTSSVHSFTIVTLTTKFPITNVVSSNMSLKTTYNISITLSTTQLRPSPSSKTQILSTTSSIAGSRGQTTFKESISYATASFREAGTIQESISLTHTSFSSSIFSGGSFSTSKAFQTTPSTTTEKKMSTSKNPANEVNVLGMNVKTGVLKNMFYGASVLAILCIILLIVVCCCWRRQTRTKLERQDTTMSNPYVNVRVEGFPSPLQLDSFVVKPESPYDMPETVPQEIDVSYVTVIDAKRNDSESHYAAVKENGTVNNVGDSESRDNDPMPSPDYTNASVFEMDPYQELMPANRIIEDHYTSLVNRDENKEDEATI